MENKLSWNGNQWQVIKIIKTFAPDEKDIDKYKLPVDKIISYCLLPNSVSVNCIKAILNNFKRKGYIKIENGLCNYKWYYPRGFKYVIITEKGKKEL